MNVPSARDWLEYGMTGASPLAASVIAVVVVAAFAGEKEGAKTMIVASIMAMRRFDPLLCHSLDAHLLIGAAGLLTNDGSHDRDLSETCRAST